MTKHLATGESSISFARSQPVPIIDLAKDLPVGYFTGEYLHTRARSGLVFFHSNMAWMIVYVAEDDTVFVLRLKDPDTILSNTIPYFDKLGVGSKHQLRTQPTSHIVVESFQNYLIIHAPLGGPVNATLRLALDAMLTEQDLVRDSYNDASRILIQTSVNLTREELDSISEDLSHIGPQELEKFLQKAIDSIFPVVASEKTHSLKKSQTRNSIQERLRSGLDIQHAKAIFKDITGGKVNILTHSSTIMATPPAKELIEQRAKLNALNLDALIKENTLRFKKTIQHRRIALLCFDCLLPRVTEEISELDDKTTCNRCGSGLLALVGTPNLDIRNLVSKKKSRKHLNPLETELLAKARRTADLILSYGKSAMIALTVIGIGPQTASTILASMHTNTSEFYYDLLKAKIHYITTRQLWEKTRTADSFANRASFNS